MRRFLPLLVALPLSLTACADMSNPTALVEPGSPAMAATPPATVAAQDDLLKSVRQATARLHSTTQAVKAGFTPDDHCVSGMGYHWVNFSRVDTAYVPTEPEVAIYAAGPDGRLRLVAVEYIVIDPGMDDQPLFGDHPFDEMGTPVGAPHWSLHVWLYKENPDGIFTNFNPTVSCP